MAWRSVGNASRSFRSVAARTPSLRSPPSGIPHLRPPPSASRGRPSFFTTSRNFGELGCTQSFLPLQSAGARLTSHLNVNMRAFCELSHGTFCRTCQDR